MRVRCSKQRFALHLEGWRGAARILGIGAELGQRGELGKAGADRPPIPPALVCPSVRVRLRRRRQVSIRGGRRVVGFPFAGADEGFHVAEFRFERFDLGIHGDAAGNVLAARVGIRRDLGDLANNPTICSRSSTRFAVAFIRPLLVRPAGGGFGPASSARRSMSLRAGTGVACCLASGAGSLLPGGDELVHQHPVRFVKRIGLDAFQERGEGVAGELGPDVGDSSRFVRREGDEADFPQCDLGQHVDVGDGQLRHLGEIERIVLGRRPVLVGFEAKGHPERDGIMEQSHDVRPRRVLVETAASKVSGRFCPL